MPPRSSATTLRPASESSFARMPPVQPRPTITASTSLSFVTMSPSLCQVRDADRVVRKHLVAVFRDVLAVNRDRAREAEHLPARLVAVAAVDRVGEHAFHHGLVHGAPERPHRQAAVEGDLCAREADQHLLALLGVKMVERLAIGLAAVRIGRRDAGAIEVGRRKRQLVALVRHALPPRTLHVQAVALTPGAGERAVDVDVDAEVGAFGAELVGRHHVVDQRLDEGGLVGVEEFVGDYRWWGGHRSGGRGGLLRLRYLGLGEAARRGGGTADHRGLEKVAATKILLGHGLLPGSPACRRRMTCVSGGGCASRMAAASGSRAGRRCVQTSAVSTLSAPSRQMATSTDMMAGPRKRPMSPKVSSPPKMPSSTHRKGRRVVLPIRIGRIKWSATKTTANPMASSTMAAVACDCTSSTAAQTQNTSGAPNGTVASTPVTRPSVTG